MNNIKVLLVDDDKELCNVLATKLNGEGDFTVCGMASDGVEALSLIENDPPDVVLLDMILPQIDGLGVLEKMATMNLAKKPQVLLMSVIGDDQFIRHGFGLGANYYLVKPFDSSIVAKRIRQMYETSLVSSATNLGGINQMENLERCVTRVIQSMGVPAHVKGYQYLRDAIIFVVEESNLMGAVTKELYPLVGDKHDTTASRVERAIRHAIELAWDRGNIDVINKYFGYTVNMAKGKPTNSEFIAIIADRIRMGEGVIC